MGGKSFFDSAQDAFYLVLRNSARFNLVGGLGSLFNLLGAIFIAGVTTGAGYLVITKHVDFTTSLSSPLAPTVVRLADLSNF